MENVLWVERWKIADLFEMHGRWLLWYSVLGKLGTMVAEAGKSTWHSNDCNTAELTWYHSGF